MAQRLSPTIEVEQHNMMVFRQFLISILMLGLASASWAQVDQPGDEEIAPEADLPEMSETIATPLPLDQIKAFANVFMRIKTNYVKPVTDEELLFWLKHKSFIVQKSIAEDVIHSTALLDEIEDFAVNLMPLMQFIWRAVDPLREETGNA